MHDHLLTVSDYSHILTVCHPSGADIGWSQAPVETAVSDSLIRRRSETDALSATVATEVPQSPQRGDDDRCTLCSTCSHCLLPRRRCSRSACPPLHTATVPPRRNGPPLTLPARAATRARPSSLFIETSSMTANPVRDRPEQDQPSARWACLSGHRHHQCQHAWCCHRNRLAARADTELAFVTYNNPQNLR